ncbi:MAG: NAD(P)H-binding protein, partial [Moorea sp. SIO3G5]|nr:NAD(P)H-binding protein [Moorena sp. SIO3G5]
MNILIFGSTGGTGRQLVEQALDQGHRVTAFARNPAKLD